MSFPKFKEFLDNHRIKYVSTYHSPAYTAAQIAALTHTPGKELAKTVIVKVDGRLVMAVVSASQQVDLALLKAAAGAKHAEIATEADFREKFPDCEVGAMPPFGNLYGMAVFADETLARDKEIAFNAGSHRELMHITWEDYAGLVHPTIAELSPKKRARPAA